MAKQHRDLRSLRPLLSAVIVFGLCVAALLPSLAQGAPSSEVLPPPTVDLSDEAPTVNGFQLGSARKINFHIPGAADGDRLELAPGGVSPQEFEAKKCSLAIKNEETSLAPGSGTNCEPLLSTKSGGKILTRHARKGKTIRVTAKTGTEKLLYEKKPDKQTGIKKLVFGVLPRTVARDREFYYQDDQPGKWFKGGKLVVDATTGRVNVPADLATLLTRNIQHAAPLQILLEVNLDGARGRTDLQRLAWDEKENETKDPPPPPFDFQKACLCELHRRRGIADTSTSSACHPKFAATGTAAAGSAPTLTRRERRERRRRRNVGVRKEWAYFVCVNYTDDRNPVVEVQTTRPGADPDAEHGGRHMFSGRDIEVRVWRRSGLKVKAELGGQPGHRRLVSPPPRATASILKTARSAAVVPTARSFNFAGRSADEPFVDLTVELLAKENGSDVTLSELTHPFTIHEVYVGAFRTAAGVSWAPFDRTWTTRATGPTSNPGREVIINDGAGSGLAHVEFIAGYTAFWWPVYERERTVSAGTFFGLGVVSTDTENGIAALTSAHLGVVELVIGRYFGIAADISIRRTQRLKEGLRVGSPVSGESITRFAVTPGFGLVFNFGPQFAKTVGLARKGFGS